MGVNIDIERLEIGQQFSQVRQGNGCAVGGGVLSHDDLQTNHPQIATRCAQLLSFRGLHRYAIFEARLCEEAALALKSRDTRPAGTSSRDGAGGKADRKSTRLKSSHQCASRMPSSACKKKKKNT